MGKHFLARAGADGKLVDLALPSAAATDAEVATALTSYGRDRGTGTSLPNTDLRRGDVYLHTGWGCLFAYNGTAWRQVETPTIATYAARNTATTTHAAALYAGFRIYLTADTGEQVWNGTFWSPLQRKPCIRVYRTAGGGYNVSSYLVVPFDGLDAAATWNQDEEWFQPLLAVSERRILIKRPGEYLAVCNMTSTVGSTTFTRVCTVPAGNTPDYTYATQGGQSAMSVTARARIGAGTYLGASHYSPSGGDVADGSSGFRTDLTITRLGD